RHALPAGGAEEPSLLDASLAGGVDQPLGARKPARRLRALAGSVEQPEREPERAAGGTHRLAALQEGGMRAHTGLVAGRVVADEERGRGEAIEVFRPEGCLRIEGGETRTRV